MDERSHTESILVATSPEALYDMVSDVTRMGEWSPVCKACWWDEGDGPREGAWFTGRNELDGRIWETRSLVVAAEPGREFAYNVLGYRERWGEEWPARFAERRHTMLEGIPATLAAIKAAAEAST